MCIWREKYLFSRRTSVAQYETKNEIRTNNVSVAVYSSRHLGPLGISACDTNTPEMNAVNS